MAKKDEVAEALAKAAEEERAEREALSRKHHTRRLMAAVDAGYTVTGLRMSDAATEHANGVVVTFDDKEQLQVVALIKKILSARK